MTKDILYSTLYFQLHRTGSLYKIFLVTETQSEIESYRFVQQT